MKIYLREILDKDFPLILQLASETVKEQVSSVRQDVCLNSVRENYLSEMTQVLNLIKTLKDYRFFVSFARNDELSGYILMDTANNEIVTRIAQAWIFDLSVADPYWNTDIPDKLLEQAENIAREKGLKHIALRIPNSNEKRVNFFKSRGYEMEKYRFYKKLDSGFLNKNNLLEGGNINIRPVKGGDIPFMERLLKENLEFFISPLRCYSKEEIKNTRLNFCNELKDKLKTGELVSFIAEEDKIPLGFFLINYNRDFLSGQSEVYVNNIVVEKSVMGKWVSNKLGRKIEEYAAEKEIFTLSADIALSNRRSILFTTRYFGYVIEQVELLKCL
ncbi:MAG TPA: GNAT family N-acetyltransferase [Candidatus Eremiobacteraeota bacterium]|nr:MAG: Acetyltransferase (GNAT) family protein [bacterium ADurb.Bin363]HPZ08356.1 GNAT family N-acetyltransferase [Candidatus Eremiobacteraeota bacterium]